ncbi:MAG TPA: FtsQ-type POTRA domain-containing protein [Dehalococcoidia bacterium]|nr:FtsQ-type POTRA domain-containing protein [Dehalococcoidia bacterium]
MRRTPRDLGLGTVRRETRGNAGGRTEIDRAAVRRRGRRLLLCLVDLAGLALIGVLMFRSPWFAVETVTVFGIDRLPPDEVARLAGITGANLFLLDPQRAADRIRAATMAKRVEVSRIPPNQVIVIVEERTAWAIWRTQAANYLIDEEGVVLGPTPEMLALPAIFDSERHLLDPGSRVDPGAIILTQRLADLLPARVGKRPIRFEYSTQGGVKAVLDGGWEVRFGTGDDLDYKLSALVVMIQDATARGQTLTQADLRFATRPYYRAADPPPARAG